MGEAGSTDEVRSPGSPRVLLVDPYIAREDPMERKFVELYPSLGLLTLAAFLQQEQIQVEIADLTFDRDLEQVRRRLQHFRPDVIGVHTKTMMFRRSKEIAALARSHGTFSVAGGPDSATSPEPYLDAGFDSVVFGEGELTLLELARTVHEGGDPIGLRGVVRRGPNGVVHGAPRSFIRDLDQLPLPAWDLVDMEAYLSRWESRTGERRSALLTSRGCPFDCSWCSKPAFGRTYRQQSPERVLLELRALKERYHVDYVRFCDDVFGISRPWLTELLDRMIEERLDLRFECLARVDLLKPDLLGPMRRAGLERVYVGVESGSQKMLDLMNRGTRLAQIERTAESLREHGIRQFWFLMLGYPGEDLEDIEATLALFRRFSPEEYSVSIAVPVPGTRFFEAVRDRLLRKTTVTRSSGGRSLLYEAAYPEALYRWQQARFEWEAALQKARGRIPDGLLEQLSHAADRFHHEIATPLLLGRRRDKDAEAAEGAGYAVPLPMVRNEAGPRRPIG